jgi:hypothetical protein
LIQVKLNGKIGFIDITGKEVTEIKYFGTSGFGSDRAMVWMSESFGTCYGCGYIDKSGKEVIEPIYEEAEEFGWYNLAKVRLEGDYGLIDTAGNVVIDIKYDDIALDFDGRNIAICDDGKCGIIDRNGNEISEMKYDEIEFVELGDLHDILAIVTLNGKVGCVGFNGKEILATKYDYIYPTVEGLFVVDQGDESIIVDRTGKRIVK